MALLISDSVVDLYKTYFLAEFNLNLKSLSGKLSRGPNKSKRKDTADGKNKVNKEEGKPGHSSTSNTTASVSNDSSSDGYAANLQRDFEYYLNFVPDPKYVSFRPRYGSSRYDEDFKPLENISLRDIELILSFEAKCLPKGIQFLSLFNTCLTSLNGPNVLGMAELHALDLSSLLSTSRCHIVSLSRLNLTNPEFIISLDTKKFSHIFSPPPFDERLYGFDPITNKCHNPKYRYMGNHSLAELGRISQEFQNLKHGMAAKLSDVNYLRQRMFGVKKILTGAIEFDNDKIRRYRTASALTRMYHGLSDQSRFSDTFGRLYSALLYLQNQNSREAHVNLPEGTIDSNVRNITCYDTVGFQYLQVIINHYGTIPINTTNNEVQLRVSQDTSTLLPVIIDCFMNVILNELFCNMTRRACILFCDSVIEYSKTSLVTEFLGNKNALRDWFKEYMHNVEIASVITYTASGSPIRVVSADLHGEFFFDEEEEIERLEKKVSELPKIGFDEYVRDLMAELDMVQKKLRNLRSKILRPNHDPKAVADFGILSCQMSELIRFRWMEIQQITNPSIYYKTSLVLEYVKSIETKVNTNMHMDEVRVSKWYNLGPRKITVELRYGELFEKLKRQYETYYEEDTRDIIIEQRGRWENNFITALTNKSGGGKIIDANNPLNPVLRSVSHTRLINFTLTMERFLTLPAMLENLSSESKCAIRFQIDRRSRLIVIVGNEVQSMEIFLLLIFNRIKMNEKSSMFVGKQVGDIRDARGQLLSSGDIHCLKNNSDIKGMDTATLPHISDFIRFLIVDKLLKYDSIDSTYFGSQPTQVDMFDEGVLRQVTLPASVAHVTKIMDQMRTMKLAIPDAYFLSTVNAELRSTDMTFMSGLFGTSAQHTILLDLSMKQIQSECPPPKTVVIQNQIMGDDRFEMIFNAKGDIDYVKQYLKYTDKFLYGMNYEQDASCSFYCAKFLQQNAILGMYVPNCARTSVFCAEKSEVSKRFPIDVIKILCNVMQTVGQRAYSIRNVLGLFRCIWNVLRTHTIYKDFDASRLVPLIQAKLTNDLTGVTTGLINAGPFKNYIVTYPYVLIFCPPISWPSCGFSYNGFVIPRSADTQMGGDSSLFGINRLFRSEHVNLNVVTNADIMDKILNPLETTVFEENVGKIMDWDGRARMGFSFGDYLSDYSRAQILSESRVEEVTPEKIKHMASNIISYLDKNKLQRSLTCFNTLNMMKLKPPHDLAYHGQPEAKIKQALVSRLESVGETSYLDVKFLSYLLKFTKIPARKFLYKHLLSFIDVRVEDEVTFDMVDEGTINCQLPFLPGYHCHSDFNDIIKYSGTPLTSGSKTGGSINTITSELGTSVDIESVVLYGAKVYHKSTLGIKEAADVVGGLIGLSTRGCVALEDLLKTYVSQGLNLEYKSIFENSKYFAIAGNISGFSKYFSTPVNTYNFMFNKIAKKYISVVARDILFSQVSELKQHFGKRIILDISIFAYIAMCSEKKRRRQLAYVLDLYRRVDGDYLTG